MKNKTLILILPVFLGCGRLGENQKYFANKDPVDIFDQKIEQESFVQETKATLKKSSIDMLFVVDNSGSMGVHQKALVDNFSTFIDKFLELNIDFKIGIITSDSAVNRDTEGKLTSKKVTNDKTAFTFKQLFRDKIKVGTGGSSNEKPAHYTKEFFNKKNSDWFATDNPLAVIIVSDENDSSPHDTNLVEHLQSFKTDSDLVKIFAITNDSGLSHRNAAIDTGGGHYDITKPFSEILDKIGKTISTLATRFKIKRQLNTEELKNIKIKVDGKEVSDAMWTFHSESSSLTFNEEFILNPKSKIEIVFGKLVSEFRLSRKLDSKRIKTVDITVDGDSIPQEHWEYKEKENSILFYGGHVPPLGSRIKIIYTDAM